MAAASMQSVCCYCLPQLLLFINGAAYQSGEVNPGNRYLNGLDLCGRMNPPPGWTIRMVG